MNKMPNRLAKILFINLQNEPTNCSLQIFRDKTKLCFVGPRSNLEMRSHFLLLRCNAQISEHETK